MKTALRLALFLLIILPSAAWPETWTGRVVSVLTGDRVVFRHDGNKRNFHIAGIEAPRLGRKGGRESRASLAKMCLNRRAWVSTDSLAGKEVRIACAWSQGNYADMALFQVDQGWARLLPDTVDPELVQAQANAQAQCLGVWLGRNPPCTTYSGDFKAPPLPVAVPVPVPVSPGNNSGNAGGGGGTIKKNPTGIAGAGTGTGTGSGAGGNTEDPITYQVTGTAPSALVTLQTPTGPLQEVVQIPFSIAYVFAAGDVVSISASSTTITGTVTVEIILNGSAQQRDTSSGTRVPASASCVRGSTC